MVLLSDSKRIFLIRWLHHVPQDDGCFPEILCYITVKSTWNVINMQRSAINNIYDATKLQFVNSAAYLVIPSVEEQTPHSSDLVIFFQHILWFVHDFPDLQKWFLFSYLMFWGMTWKKLHSPNFPARKPGAMWDSNMFVSQIWICSPSYL